MQRIRLTTLLLFSIIHLGPIQGKPQSTVNPKWTEPIIVSGDLPGSPKFLHIAARKSGGALLVWDQAFVDNSLNPDEIFFREFDGS